MCQRNDSVDTYHQRSIGSRTKQDSINMNHGRPPLAFHRHVQVYGRVRLEHELHRSG